MSTISEATSDSEAGAGHQSEETSSAITYNKNLVEPDRRGVMRRLFKRYGSTMNAMSPRQTNQDDHNRQLTESNRLWPPSKSGSLGDTVVTELSFHQFNQLLHDMGVGSQLGTEDEHGERKDAPEEVLMLSKMIFDNLQVIRLGFDVFPTALSLVAERLFPSSDEKVNETIYMHDEFYF